MPSLRSTPTFSVVINTNGRCASLRTTIESFRHLDYPAFELCVVHGPTPDGTAELVEAYAADGAIKTAACPERNLSQSRNIGIAMASGEIVAFIDDDAIPEAEWLTDLATAFEDPQTAAAGGKVFDPSGFTVQYHYAACDRLGNARLGLTQPADGYNFPFSNVFPYVQGTNAAVRRSVLAGIGGFDEEYEFYLDETDVCCRLVDAGHYVRQLSGAAVHHKFLPSHLRNETRVTTVFYSVIKNKIYFSLINNQGHFSTGDVLSDNLRFVEHHRDELSAHVVAGRVPPTVLDDFEQDVERAWRVGLQRGFSQERRTRPASYFDTGRAFVHFPALRPDSRRRRFVFLSQTYPPAGMDGVARYTHDIANAIGAHGHNVHVITRSTTENSVDLENGVWVHRLVPKQVPPRSLPSGTPIPQHITAQSGTALEELYRIASTRPVDVVEGTSWDCECIAPLLDGRFATVTNIVTTLSHWLETHKEQSTDANWMAEFGTPMLEVERYIFGLSPGIIAASDAIARSVEKRYDVTLDPARIGYLPHGLADMQPMPRATPPELGEAGNGLRILFVGRLELRKGIDVLLDVALELLASYAEIEFWFAGDDTLVLDGGLTARARFEAAAEIAGKEISRARFFGRVNDSQLRWLYAACDIYVSPSRYESFGLIFVEAMMFSKPCVGSRVGGTREVIEEGVDGLLVEPADRAALAAALSRLILNPSLRQNLGSAGRASYERRFNSARVATERIAFLSDFARTAVPRQSVRVFGKVETVETGFGESGLSLGRQAELVILSNAAVLHLTFWTHAWSGYAEIWSGGEPIDQVDLYSTQPEFRTVTVSAPAETHGAVRIRRLGAGQRRGGERRGDLLCGRDDGAARLWPGLPRAVKVSIVNGICVRHDAISEAVRGTFQALSVLPEADCRLFTYMSDYCDMKTRIVSSAAEILLDAHFMQSALIVYHFGIYYELFNALLLGNGQAPQLVRYHNVTPKEFLQPHQHALSEKSINQIANMEMAAHIWADSAFNKQHLVDYGIDPDKIEVSPLYVKTQYASTRLPAKPVDEVRILYVGRFVQSKGLLDLVEAVAAVRAATRTLFRVTLAGNLSFSEPAYLAALRELITRRGLDDVVSFMGGIDDAALWNLYCESHIFVIPSYHEGFCVPALEALRAGCLPVAYAAGNLPDLLRGVGEVVTRGDVTALAERMLRHVLFFGARNRREPMATMLPLEDGPMSMQAYADRVEEHVRQYSYAAFSDRLRATVRALA